jgi:hypothetical protein
MSRVINYTGNKGSTFKNFPISIEENIYFLYRWGIIEEHQFYGSTKNQKLGQCRSILDSCSFQNEWYLTDVFFMFGCYRVDYEFFLFPVANKLAEKGLSVTILIYNRTSLNLSMLSNKINIIYYDQLLNEFKMRYDINKYFTSNLLGDIEKFSNKMQFNSKQRHGLKTFYKQYLFDQLFTTALLDKLKPKCIYGIHFILNPGCIQAIKNSDFPIICSLIQHGLINQESSIVHDFYGADLVFLWGDYFQRIMKKKMNAPFTKVIGNPKLEQIKLNLNHNKPEIKGVKGNLKILYICNGVPEQVNNNKNLSLFFDAIFNIKNINVIYKIHPSISVVDYKEYISAGLMKQSQITKDRNTYELIRESDIIIGDYSSTIFEAAALNKPVIQIYQENYPREFVQFTYASNSVELIRIINQLRNNEKYMNSFMKSQNSKVSNVFQNIEGSSDRIASYIEYLVTK